jgi:hypothetical protein
MHKRSESEFASLSDNNKTDCQASRMRDCRGEGDDEPPWKERGCQTRQSGSLTFCLRFGDGLGRPMAARPAFGESEGPIKRLDAHVESGAWDLSLDDDVSHAVALFPSRYGDSLSFCTSNMRCNKQYRTLAAASLSCYTLHGHVGLASS